MIKGRGRIALAAAALVILLLGAVLLASPKPGPPPRPPEQRPELMLLTTLPILFPERLTLESAGSPAMEALQSRYRVSPISVAATGELGNRRLLLMAQPQAQPAEILVELDQWVRAGGRVLLLADPALEWPSERGFGDKLRPPAAFADTGLLGHWGLALDSPQARGPASRQVGNSEIRTNSAGMLSATGPACTVLASGLIARCRLGGGQATVIADADLLNPDDIEGASPNANFGLILNELARLGQ